MRNPQPVFALLAAFISLSAQGADIQVQAKCTPFDFSYFSYSFAVNYADATLPQGSHVELQAGYAGKGSINSEFPNGGEEFHWWSTKMLEPVEVRSGAASLPIKVYYMQTSGYLSDLEFRFKITLPDGRVYWDNGGFSTSFYRALFFIPGKFECDKLQNMTPLKVGVVSPYR